VGGRAGGGTRRCGERQWCGGQAASARVGSGGCGRAGHGPRWCGGRAVGAQVESGGGGRAGRGADLSRVREREAGHTTFFG
jgi:hypothetical protein